MRTKRVWMTDAAGKESIVTMNEGDDPYNDCLPYHKAAGHLERNGRTLGVIPLCRIGHKHPRAVNLKRETWTLRWEAVTCPRCLAMKDKSQDELRAIARAAK